MGCATTLCTLLLLLPLLAWGETYYVSQQAMRRHGRTVPKGSDSHTCEQARNPAMARATINGCLACVAPGDTCHIGLGHYNEIIVGYYNSEACSSSDAAVQQPCAIFRNGLDAERPTRLLGSGEAVVSPRGKAAPGGGGILTLYDAGRFLHIEGLRFVGDSASGSAAGVHLGGSQYVTLHHNEIARSYGGSGALVSSSSGSRYHTITANDVHHAGQGCNPRVQTSPPCPHGMYIQGQDHWISDNTVSHGTNYGIQVSAEGGGIARVTVAMNRVEYNQGVGIRISGSDNKAIANLLVKNGVGMTITGTGLVASNTFDGYHPDTAYDDVFGLWVDGNQTHIVNNIFTNQKSAWLMMQQRSGSTFVPVDPAVVHSNGCDLAGNSGCTNVHPSSTWYTDAASGDYTILDTSPARGAGQSGTGVEVDITHYPYVTPDLGAYAWRGTPEPPQPEPVPPGGPLTLTCSGDLLAGGKIAMQCVQQVEGRR